MSTDETVFHSVFYDQILENGNSIVLDVKSIGLEQKFVQEYLFKHR